MGSLYLTLYLIMGLSSVLISPPGTPARPPLIAKAQNLYVLLQADALFLFIYIASIAFLFVVTSYKVVENGFRPITNFIIISEQVRIFMKVYSFVRETAPRVLQYVPSKDGKQEQNLYPTVRHYLYYLYCPAAIYKDSYPRKKEINYNFVAAQLFRFFACIVISYCACVRFMVNIYRDVGSTPFTMKEAVMTLAVSMFLGTLCMFMMFYGFLHSWLNIWAELLRFADREFYKIVRVHYFVRGGFVGYRSRASSKHLSPHLPVGSLDSSGGSNRGCAGSEVARVGVESTKKPTPDVVVVFET
ncbi:sterol O-acyltransferase 1 [Trichonephila clavipes]|nr:sterol O-acyltransferase 1 [Trichonephila clavipes]